jgi:cellulose synthase/poly-beta-1,6-N-acetylglucosamine synthase-like glycosyltransferase
MQAIGASIATARRGGAPDGAAEAPLLRANHAARDRLTLGQALAFAGMAGMLAAAGWLTGAPLVVLGVAITPVCLVACIIHLGASVEARPAEPPEGAGPARWPHYSILVPLYREARVVPQLLAALRALDYPRDRLDVILLVEADDPDTAGAIAAQGLLAHERAFVVPPGEPRTKPRALNHGLLACRQGLVVVYDAEDIPDADQLRKAARMFAASPADVVCLQAKLDIDNGADGVLPELFRLEYLAQFHAVKPGLAADALAVPLGGTSNHFRRDALLALGGWDP